MKKTNRPLRSYIYFIAISFLVTTFVSAQPIIQSFSPASGPVGSVVTINGSNFNTTPANNIVYFGAVRATVTAATANTITVTVPYGATYQPLSVTSAGLTAYASNSFIVTFPGAGNLNQNSFGVSFDSTTDLHPNGIVIADLDGDGKPDLATANNYSTTGSPASVSILRNTSSTGSISFDMHHDIATGVQTYSIACADFDGDGKPDLVSTSVADKKINILRNTSSLGLISFASSIDYATGDAALGINTGDLDGDGRPDIAVTNYLSNTISIYRNTSITGNISFATRVDINTNADLAPSSIAIGDLDGDNKPELAVTNAISNTISVFRNTSTINNIAFAPQIHFFAGASPQGIIIGDVDGDGKPDLSWALYGSPNSLWIELNKSTTGNLVFVATTGFNYNASNTYNVCMTDLNGDGKPDLIVPYTNRFKLLQNASTPGNKILNSAIDMPGNSPYAVAAGDLDADGYPDLVFTNFTSNTISVYKNTVRAPAISSFTPSIAAPGTTVTITGVNFLTTTGVNFGGTPAASYTVVDNNTIIAVTGAGAGGNITVTTATGSITVDGFSFTAPPTLTSFSPTIADSGVVVTIKGINFVGATAVNFGGVPASSFIVVSPSMIKAVVGNGASGNISISNPYGTGDISGMVADRPVIASFSPTTAGRGDTVTINGSNFSNISEVSFGGLSARSFMVNSPNTIKAVVAGGCSGDVRVKVFRSYSLPGYNFVLPPAPVIDSISAISGIIGSTVTISGSHFNTTASKNLVSFGNIKANVVAGSSTSLTVIVPAGAPYDHLTVLDTDNYLYGRSIQSFAVATSVPGIIDTSLFAPSLFFKDPNRYDPREINLCDFNGDGKLDIVGAIPGSALYLRKNTSTGNSISFANGMMIFSKGAASGYDNISRMKTADFDGDGKADILALRYFANEMGFFMVFRNSSNTDSISFAAQVDFQAILNVSDAFPVDIDGDGRMDIIIHSSEGNIIFQNTSSGPGDISFQPVNYPFPAGGLIVPGDFNADGKMDIIYKVGFDLYFLRNNSTNGVISFGTPTQIYTNEYDHSIWDISKGDIDGDGKTDIVIANSGTAAGSYAILKNISTGPGVSFAVTNVVDADLPRTCRLSDIDGDGKPDLLMNIQSGISIARNSSSPGTISFEKKVIFTHVTNKETIAAGDFNQDSKMDLALSTFYPNLEILRNTMGELHITSNGPTTFCEGNTVTLSSTAALGNQWYRNGILIAGATANTLTVSVGGFYTDTVIINGTISFAPAGAIITVNSIPAKPTISRDANSNLVSSAVSGNQWYRDTNIINGATGQTYRPAANGSYAVRVTEKNCSGSLSNQYAYSITGIVDINGQGTINIYPNPVQNDIRIDYHLPLINGVIAELYDFMGLKIFSKNIYPGYSINLSTYPNGNYFLNLRDKTSHKLIYSTHVIKLK